MLLDVVLIHQTRIMRDDDGLALIAFKAFRGKHIFRESKLPADGSIRVQILKDADGCNDRMVNEVSLFGPVGLIQLDTVEPLWSAWGSRSF